MNWGALLSRLFGSSPEDVCAAANVLEGPQCVSEKALAALVSSMERDSSRHEAMASIAAVLLAAPGLSGQIPVSILERCRQDKKLSGVWPQLAILMLHTQRKVEVADWSRAMWSRADWTADPNCTDLQLLQHVSEYFPEVIDAQLLESIVSRSDGVAPYMVLLERQLFREGASRYKSIDSGVNLAELLKEEARLLVVHNIVDGLGDELIRTNALMQAILDGCPEVHITLFTDRTFLYDHPRVQAFSIKDTERFCKELSRRWDGIINFFEPYLDSNSYNVAAETALKAYLKSNVPRFLLWARKDVNHFVFESVLLKGTEFVEKWQLNERRFPSCYETSMRLITELGLPLRFGEHISGAGWLLASMPEEAMRSAWQSMLNELSTRPDGTKRPTALLNIFGGQNAMKGFQKCTYARLHQIMAQMIGKGFDLVLVPTGSSWGGRPEIDALIAGLPDQLKRHTIAAPLGHALGPQETIRWIKYFAYWSDFIVTVEGWMMHLAYAMAKPYYLLLAPYSYGFEWHPHGRSVNQGGWLGSGDRKLRPELFLPDAQTSGVTPPLLHHPEKTLLKSALEIWSTVPDRNLAGRLLYWMGSEDKDIRSWVVTAIGKMDAVAFQRELIKALEDCNREVRAAAASALLFGGQNLSAELGKLGQDWRQVLLAYQLLGQFRFQELRPLGQNAYRALRACLNRDESEVHRDATIMLESMGMLKSCPELKVHKVCDQAELPRVLILTPVKNAVQDAEGYFARLRALCYPANLLSVGILESDSSDDTFETFRKYCQEYSQHFRSVRIWKKDFDYQIPPDLPRWEPSIQLQRRAILARSRNHLLFHALDDEDWVLWLDSDVIEYPADIIQRLLSYDKDIVQPHCVKKYCGPSFDLNAWRDHGRLFLHDLRPEGEIIPIDAVGGTMLLIRADCHRDGLVFPPFLYGKHNGKVRVRGDIHLPNEEGEVETEGLGILASDMNFQCWALPHLEIIHADR